MQKRELCKHDCKYIYKKEKSNLMFNIFLSSFCSITKILLILRICLLRRMSLHHLETLHALKAHNVILNHVKLLFDCKN